MLLRFARKNLRRRPGRTLLTIGGVAAAMLLLVLVESLSAGLDRAMSGTEAARTLIVYRANRYCPQTSFMPENYAARIARIDGVESVLPVKVYLNNCRASLDVVPFQGAPVDQMLESRGIAVEQGDLERFRREAKSALVGRALAQRKGLEPGDQFRFGNIDVDVAGIFSSPEPIEEGVVLTHLEFLQRAGPVNRLGTVTQFEVKVADAARAKAIGEEIDALFRTAQEPTDTRAKILYLEGATRDLREILRFARLLGIACALVALSLVANTVLMSVNERVRELAVVRTLGYREGWIAGLVLTEALALALCGGLFGIGLAFGTLELTHLTLGAEGVPVVFTASPKLALEGLALALLTGALAGLFPAWRSARSPIVQGLRSA
ncbi:MAG: FtsX-like permease family protein [Planctomycetes bacterium]|nr:FtsX-like permease family protein [Planctomycetota bacterium]